MINVVTSSSVDGAGSWFAASHTRPHTWVRTSQSLNHLILPSHSLTTN